MELLVKETYRPFLLIPFLLFATMAFSKDLDFSTTLKRSEVTISTMKRLRITLLSRLKYYIKDRLKCSETKITTKVAQGWGGFHHYITLEINGKCDKIKELTGLEWHHGAGFHLAYLNSNFERKSLFVVDQKLSVGIREARNNVPSLSRTLNNFVSKDLKCIQLFSHMMVDQDNLVWDDVTVNLRGICPGLSHLKVGKVTESTISVDWETPAGRFSKELIAK